MTTFTDIETAARRHGLSVVGAFHPGLDDKAPEGIATLVLVGPDGPEMWDTFAASPEFADGQEGPLDRWSSRVINELAEALGGRAFFPFGGPPWHAFQHWAARGEGAEPSPVVMQASPTRGLWASYRGALGFTETLDLPERQTTSPCLDCPAPCLSACPVEAFKDGAYNVPVCTAHVQSQSGADCRDGCRVRRACPAGARVGLPEAQRRFHMAAFLAANG